MSRKPKVVLEAWQLLMLHGRPFQLWGHATGHPRLGGFRRFIATSRVLKLSADQRRAETVNTIFELRHPIRDVVYRGPTPIRILLGDLVAECERTDTWRVRRGREHLADGLPGMNAAVLVMLAQLDRDRRGDAQDR